jgi:hypothetical protein
VAISAPATCSMSSPDSRGRIAALCAQLKFVIARSPRRRGDLRRHHLLAVGTAGVLRPLTNPPSFYLSSRGAEGYVAISAPATCSLGSGEWRGRTTALSARLIFVIARSRRRRGDLRTHRLLGVSRAGCSSGTLARCPHLVFVIASSRRRAAISASATCARHTRTHPPPVELRSRGTFATCRANMLTGFTSSAAKRACCTWA